MSFPVPVTFHCKECGTKLIWADDATDETEIFCQGCGKRFGTYADLRHTALNAVQERAEASIKDALKNR